MLKQTRILHTKNGQGLLEAVIGIGVILAGTIGTLTLISSTSLAGTRANEKVVAASLAREGIETVRNTRDTNWLRIQANVDTDGNPLNGIQLPSTWDGIFTVMQSHFAVPAFDPTANAWSLQDVAAPGFDTNCVAVKCSQVYQSGANPPWEYVQRTTGAFPVATAYQRILTLNPICRFDKDGDGVPDVTTDGNHEPKEEVVTTNGSTCSVSYILVGAQVLSSVVWKGGSCPGQNCYVLEERLYNWKYAK